jgi:hypothetical protein
MANRRGNSDDRPNPRKPKVPLPVVGRSEGRLRRERDDGQADSSSRPARGRTSTISRPVARGGQGDYASLKRFVFLSTLGLALTISLALFIQFVFGKPDIVPLVARLSNSERPNVFGEHPASALFQTASEQKGSKSGARLNKRNSFDITNIENVLSLENKIPKAGGRNGNIIVFYLNGIVTADSNDSDSVQLWLDDASFATSSQEQKAIDLKTLLSDISSKLSGSTHALVILDVAPPSVTTNLGDLEFPTNAIQKIFEMEDVNNQRLSILLPCDQSQESWIAPELGSSVFGHFSAEGLETGFNDPELSIRTYANEVTRKVSEWVRLNRYATQSPVLLTSEKVELTNFKLFARFFAPPQPTPPEAIDYQSRTEALTKLWGAFTKLKGYRWLDPVLYGCIESQFLILEDIAETTGTSWAERIRQIEKDMEELQTRWKSTPRPSLIESRFYQQLGLKTSTSFSIELPGKTLEGEVNTVGIASHDKAILLWNTWYKVASEGGASDWREEFSPTRMKERLNDLGPTEQIEWLEIQFGRILCDGAFANADDSRAEAIAKLIKAFGDLQTIATKSKAFGTREVNPTRVPWERTRLMQNDFDDLETRLLESVDHFIVSNYKEVINRLEDLKSDIDAIKKDADNIDEVIEFRDRVIYEAPHLLAFLLREHRYLAIEQRSNDNASPQWEEKFKEIKSKLAQARDVEKKLDEANIKGLQNVSIEEWAGLIDSALSDITLESGQGEDSRTIRVYRAALRSPFITTSKREKWYAALSEIFKKSNTAEGEATTEFATSNVFKLSNELKEELGSLLFRLSEKNVDLSAAAQSRSQLFRLSRFYKKPMGSNQAADDRGSLRSTLMQQEKTFLEWQQLRCYRSRFGAGKLPDEPEEYYFRKLAKSYSNPLFIPDKSTVPTPVDVEDSWKSARNSFAELQKSKVDLSENETKITIQDSKSWMKVVNKEVKIGVAANTNKIVGTMDLGTNDQPRSIEVKEPQRANVYELLLRGHNFELAMTEQKALSRFQSQFENDIKPASLTVKTKPKTQAIAILLDCSASMDYNESGKSRPFDEAKKVIDLLLNSLVKLHETGLARSEVCLVPFGLPIKEQEPLVEGQPSEARYLLQDFEVARIGETSFFGTLSVFNTEKGPKKLFGSTAVIRSDFFPCGNLDELFRLKGLLANIPAEGTTPLYNAMAVGLNELKSRNSDIKKLVVLSDGANDDGNKNVSLETLQRQLESMTDVSVYFFQFENVDYYTRAKIEKGYDGQNKEENAKFFRILNDIPSRPDGLDTQASFRDFGILRRAVEASFALPDVTVTPPIDGPITFNQSQSMPSGKYTLSVNNRGSNRGAGIDLIIRGGEKLEIEYDGQLNTLSMPPAKFLPLALDPDTAPKSSDKWTADKRKVNNALAIQVRRDWNNKSKSGPLKLIPRPAVCIAKVTDPRGISYMLADYRIADVYPPTLEFPLVLAQVPDTIRFDLWFSDNEKQLPGLKTLVPLSTTHKLPTGTLSRDAKGKITADLLSSRDDRVFVICLEASEVTRDIRGLEELDRNEITEKHVFTFDQDFSEPAVYVIKESELNNKVEVGRVFNSEFPLK